MLSLISAAAALIPTALWKAIGGAVLVLMGWLGVKAYGRAAERRGAAEAELRQREDVARRREAMVAVAKPSPDETIARLRRGEG